MTPDLAYDHFMDVSGALSMLVVLAMLLERALALLFEYHWFQKLSERWQGLKSPIAFLASWYTCHFVQFDVLARLFPTTNGPVEAKPIGMLITAAIVAGGSAGAMTLFQGVLKFNRESRTSIIEANLAESNSRKDKAEAEAAEAKARKEKAEAEAAEAAARKKALEA